MFTGYFSITSSASSPASSPGSTSPGSGTNSARAVTLASVTSPYFKKITMHRPVVRNGVAETERVKNFTIQPGQTRVYESGGFHLMLMQATVKVKIGKALPIKIKFQSGKEKTVVFKVRRH